MNVHAYFRGATRNAKREICAFGSDATKRCHHIIVARQLAAEFLDDALRHVSDVGCFRLVEARRPNQRRDFAYAQSADFLRRWCRLEEPDCCRQRHFIESSDRDYTGSKLVKWSRVTLIC